jgi:hypothetical protein
MSTKHKIEKYMPTKQKNVKYIPIKQKTIEYMAKDLRIMGTYNNTCSPRIIYFKYLLCGLQINLDITSIHR